MMGLATGMHVAMGQNQPMMMAAPPQGPNPVNQGQGGVSPHPKPKVMCSHPGCGKEFAWQQDLAKHVRRYHSGEEPRFACTHDGCEKKFYERKLLVAHERTHTDERPFACKYPGLRQGVSRQERAGVPPQGAARVRGCLTMHRGRVQVHHAQG